jgi:RNA polymerase I-specific transcription initiation factor RRN7
MVEDTKMEGNLASQSLELEESSEDDEADTEAQMNREIEKLLREASETDSNSDLKKLDTSERQRAYNKNTRYTLYDSSAMNISILVLTCWWLRVPVVYSDFIE